MKKKKIYIGDLLPKSTLATPKQLGFIEGLILNKNIQQWSKEEDGSRMNIKQASNMIDCLLKKIPFEIVDKDKISKKRKQIFDAKYKARLEERQKMDKAKNVEVKPITWIDKPKTFDYTPKISLAEQQAKLRRLESQED